MTLMPLNAQTLTPTRGLFSVKGNPTSEEKRRALKDSVVIAIMADGNVRTVLTAKGDAPTPTAGALGLSFGRYNSNFTVLVNVVGRVDSVTADFGASLLPPTSGGATSSRLSALIDFRQLFRKAMRIGPISLANGFGWHVYLSGAPVAWVDTATTNHPSYKAFVIGAGLQLSREVYNQDVAGTSVSVVFDGGPALRSLKGDVTSTNPTRADLRTRLLGTANRDFLGLETGLTIQMKEVRMGVSYYHFGGQVDGLSNGQAVFGFSVANSFFAGRTTKAPLPTTQ